MQIRASATEKFLKIERTHCFTGETNRPSQAQLLRVSSDAMEHLSSSAILYMLYCIGQAAAAASDDARLQRFVKCLQFSPTQIAKDMILDEHADDLIQLEYLPQKHCQLLITTVASATQLCTSGSEGQTVAGTFVIPGVGGLLPDGATKSITLHFAAASDTEADKFPVMVDPRNIMMINRRAATNDDAAIKGKSDPDHSAKGSQHWRELIDPEPTMLLLTVVRSFKEQAELFSQRIPPVTAKPAPALACGTFAEILERPKWRPAGGQRLPSMCQAINFRYKEDALNILADGIGFTSARDSVVPLSRMDLQPLGAEAMQLRRERGLQQRAAARATLAKQLQAGQATPMPGRGPTATGSQNPWQRSRRSANGVRKPKQSPGVSAPRAQVPRDSY